MEKEHLHLLINEEIYRLPSDEIVEGQVEKEAISKTKDEIQTIDDVVEKAEASTHVAEPEPEIVSELKKETKTEDSNSQEEPKQESPEIPITQVEEPEELPFAVFHSSSDENEISLLHKIIDACKIPSDQYKIFSQGFDQTVKFKKALVFVTEAKAFYTPIPYKGSEFLCSKPLSHLVSDQNEKAKLWGALQKFVL